MTANPKWWNTEATTGWDRVKEAFRRDWEQTKADFSSKGKELDQDADDTIMQAAGKQPIPPGNTPNPTAWNDAEAGVRYGWGAANHYKADRDWNDRVESKLREEWTDLKTGRTWDEVKSAVRRGWDSARRKVAA